MASLDRLPSGKWRVRWHVTSLTTTEVHKGQKIFSYEGDARQFMRALAVTEQQIKQGVLQYNRSIDAAAALFLDSKQNDLAPLTITGYRKLLSTFTRWCNSHSVYTVDMLTTGALEHYKASLAASVSKNTQINHLILLRSLCKFISRIYAVADPSLAVTICKESPRRRRIITADELALVLSVCKPYQADRILVLAHTGIRASEFLSLVWTQPSGRLAQHVGWPDGSFQQLTVIGKGQKERHIPCNSIVQSIFARLSATATHNHIFLSKNTKDRLTYPGLRKSCTCLAQRAGIPDFGPHALRHFFITQLILAGVPMKVVAMIVGHSSIATTEKIYTHILPADYRGVTELLVAKK